MLKFVKNMQHYYESIQGWFNFEKVYSLMVERSQNHSKFVEVGSWLGKSSVYMAVEINNSGKDIKFYTVDTWEGSLDENDKDKNLHEDLFSKMNKSLYDSFLENIIPVENIITPIRKKSIEASKDFEDNSLDFVYIDANHQFRNVLEDLKSWYPKVKSGGVIAGHDYDEHWKEVKKAVDVFFKNCKDDLKFYDNTWFYEKP